jgi:hypothetical protein
LHANPKVRCSRGRSAGSPKTAALPVHPHPPVKASRDRPGSTTRTPKGTRRPRCVVTPKGTVANAGGGSRGSIPRRRSVSPEGARSPAIAAVPKNVATPGTPLCDSSVPKFEQATRSAPRRHPKVPPRRTQDRSVIDPRSLPEGRSRTDAPLVLHPGWNAAFESARTPPKGCTNGRVFPRVTRRWALPDSWLRPHSSKLEVAGLGPDRHRLHRDGQNANGCWPPLDDPKVAELTQAPGARL